MHTNNEDQRDDENIALATFADMQAWHRPGTTDQNALKEVLVKRAYRQPTVGFDVEAGEHWADLGANIGAFALYCQSKGATAECYEPLPSNFALLRKNVPQFACHPTAISNLQAPEVAFWTSRRERDHYRGTLLERGIGYPQVTVKNTHATALLDRKFDGIKMDIEGSEFGLIDEWLLPKANKLVLEYHTSRDNNLENLARRIGILKQHYQHVHYCPELARLVERGTGTGKTFYDRIVFCWNDHEEATSMGGAALPTITNDPDDDHIERGKQAWKRLKEAGRNSWEEWKLIGTALMTGREHAMAVAKTKKNGKRYSEQFNIWLQIHDFHTIDKADRTKLLSIMEDLERIEKWRAADRRTARRLECSLDRLADFALQDSRHQSGHRKRGSANTERKRLVAASCREIRRRKRATGLAARVGASSAQSNRRGQTRRPLVVARTANQRTDRGGGGSDPSLGNHPRISQKHSGTAVRRSC